MRPIIVAGISTEVGKTVVSTILTESLASYYWKPVECGEEKDSFWVASHLSHPERCFPPSFSFKTPCSPHLAARLEAVSLKAKDLVPPVCEDFLVIEGTGGILAPLNETETWMDAALSWQGQWILVHRHYLGSLNHFALTIEAMRARNISLLGVVFNGAGDAGTEEMLLKKGNTRCLGRLLWHDQLTPSMIRETAALWKQTLQSALGS